ncbi:1-acyl-sn-glycerol-3-phosphate acyltransferase [Agreia sp. COWG]|uniref:lysophospholipid acyltransferase family protein n=1 Tax=Agreia sp. COWG TaxID=2773266 RepID=UPI001926AA9D|nr:lysophospholipid acyltransferase family protein [Agreia sp. COWG]CAD6006348.1 1-acyl-sn-glycerol-3-phosphate acyltransferase [Agreia sp. COWG]
MLTLLSRALLAPAARALYRPRVIGRDNVPRTGRVLLASNHLSFIDSVVLTLVAPRTVSFLAKSDYFTGEGVKGRLSRGFFTAIGAIPVERAVGQAAQDALDAGLAVLERDEAFAIYPEGTRSRDGRIYKGKTGAAWLAMSSSSLIVPVALTGTQELQPVGSKLPRLHRVTVEFGRPIDASEYGQANSARARRRLTDVVMDDIQRMSGQEKANAYNEVPAATPLEKVKRAFGRNRPS